MTWLSARGSPSTTLINIRQRRVPTSYIGCLMEDKGGLDLGGHGDIVESDDAEIPPHSQSSLLNRTHRPQGHHVAADAGGVGRLIKLKQSLHGPVAGLLSQAVTMGHQAWIEAQAALFEGRLIPLETVPSADELGGQADEANAPMSLINEVLHPIADPLRPIHVNVGETAVPL